MQELDIFILDIVLETVESLGCILGSSLEVFFS